MLAAVDSNLLLYAEGMNDAVRNRDAKALFDVLPLRCLVIPVLSLGEVYHVLVRRGGLSRQDARDAVQAWEEMLSPAGLSPRAMSNALRLASQHQMQIWDAAILSTAAEAGCTVLLSEDMQTGFVWGGVTVVNPFSRPQHPLLVELLAQ